MLLSPIRPSARAIREYLDSLLGSSYSYDEINALAHHHVPEGFLEDHNRRSLGSGERVFETAKAAVRSWKMFDLDWISVHPHDAPIACETMVAIVAHNFGVWTVNPARIVSVIRQHGEVERFGFTYGSLPGHAESGEEQFAVEWHRDDDSVWYDLHGISKPGRWFSAWGYPLTRKIQARFAAESMDAMERAVAEEMGK